MSQIKLKLEDIEKAQHILQEFLEPTPLLLNSWISEKLNCKVYLKLENMQPIGSFKIRGATNKIASLSAAERKKGIVAASAGNHAQGVAWGAKKFKTKATIVMPENASLTKIQNTKALGAEIVLSGENYEQAYTVAMDLVKKTKAVFVHAYEDPYVIAGQGTAGLEILKQLPDVDVVIGSIGGGGLMCGVGTAVKSIRPQTKIIGSQAHGANCVIQSFRNKKIISTKTADTFADGIKTISTSPAMFNILNSLLDEAYDAEDELIAASVLMLLEKAKVVAEGAGALPLAILSKHKNHFRGKKVVLLISGGNIDVNLVSRIIDRGLIQNGRRVRLNVFIPDKPGSLSQLTSIIANNGGNVLQVIHDRDSPGVGIHETNVELTLETKGHQHSKQIVQALKHHVLKLTFLH